MENPQNEYNPEQMAIRYTLVMDEIMIQCPLCHQPLKHHDKSWRCKNNHSFDQARQGYVNLSLKQKPSGDNKEMVQARSRFLEKGYYQFLADALTDLIQKYKPETLLDLGCGQGWYTRQMGQLVPQSFGMDLSVPAIAHAAGQDKHSQYIVGSIYQIPFEDNAIDMMTSIFTPLPAKEAKRVLKEDGLFITVAPDTDHLVELKQVLYDKVRLNDEPPIPEGFVKAGQIEISQKHHVEDPVDLLKMTPYYYRSPKEGIERLSKLDNGLDVTFSFVIQLWKKEGTAHESKN